MKNIFDRFTKLFGVIAFILFIVLLCALTIFLSGMAGGGEPDRFALVVAFLSLISFTLTMLCIGILMISDQLDGFNRVWFARIYEKLEEIENNQRFLQYISDHLEKIESNTSKNQ